MSIVNLPSPTDLSGFYVVFKGSTNLEKKGIFGISHLLEHLVCKAIDPYEDELDMLGITNNAYTSSNEVVFHLKGLNESLNKWRTKYVELIGEFNVTKEEFENERNIVLQEYMDSFNGQAENHWLNLERKKFGHYSAIGLKEDLKSLTYMDCLNYFEKQFTNPSMIINVSKDVEFGMDLDFKVPEITSHWEIGEYPVNLERNNKYIDKVSLIMTSSEMIKEDYAKINFINNMYSYGLQSPLYQEIREKRGLAYYVGTHLNRMNQEGYNSIYTMSTKENIDKIVEIISTIFKSPEDFLTKKRFDVVRGSTKVKLKEKEINRYNNVHKWINPEGWSSSDIIDDITYDEVLELSKKYFTLDNFDVSRDDEEFE